jgi:hypothetical protein
MFSSVETDMTVAGMELNTLGDELFYLEGSNAVLLAAETDIAEVLGYLAREVVAPPNTTDALAANMAIAWNPSWVGAKVEDTFVISADGTSKT